MKLILEIHEQLLKVALNTITLTLKLILGLSCDQCNFRQPPLFIYFSKTKSNL